METSLEYLYKMVMWHEFGHFLDTLLRNSLTSYVQNRILANDRPWEEKFAWISDNVSNYATSSPREAAAELFSMLLEIGYVPPEFAEMQLFLLGQTSPYKEAA